MNKRIKEQNDMRFNETQKINRGFALNEVDKILLISKYILALGVKRYLNKNVFFWIRNF